MVTLAGLPAALDGDWVDRSRRPAVVDGVACVPVKAGEPCDLEIPERRLYQGRGYQILGDIVLLHGSRPMEEEMERIRDRVHPRGILWVQGITGTERSPRAELVWGRAGEVRHREHGCTFVLDPEQVMYAMGNLSERHRVVGLAGAGAGRERVADLFAGIGYFTIPLAKAGSEVHAMEISPVAFGFLTRNIRENYVSGRVHAEQGDCRDLLNGTYDRFIMGHFDSPGYLPDALAHARRGSVIHLHTLSDVTGQIVSEAREAGFEARISTRRVKSYAPHTWHMVQDVALS